MFISVSSHLDYYIKQMNTKEINRQIRETKESERRDFIIGALN